MSDTKVAAGRRRRRSSRGRRVLLYAVGIGWAVLLLAAGWLAVTAVMVRGEVKHLKAGLSQLRGEVEAGDLDRARATAESLQRHADRAHRLSTGPAWATAAAIPYLGGPLETVRGAAAAAAELADDGLPGVIEAASQLNLSDLRTADGGIEVGRIAAAAPAIDKANTAAAQALSTVQGLPTSTWLTEADDARSTLARELQQLSATLETADRAARIAPALLGAQTPQRYFIGFQNDAEARGTGGLPGALAIVEVDQGQIRFTAFESDQYLRSTPTGLNLGPDFALAYDAMDATAVYMNTNVSAHFPYAASIWAAMWEAKTGQHIDGAISVDPTALSYLLGATGPTALADGTQITAGDVVELTQSRAYALFDDQELRKQFLVDIAKAVSEHLLDPQTRTAALLKAAGHASSERRLLIWSADASIQAELEQTSLAGAIPEGPDPFSGFTVNNAGGNKLDYYLDRSMTWSASGCGEQRTVTATLTLTNNAPTSGLTSYVNGRLDKPDYPVGSGDNAELVSYYATQGSRLLSATLDGVPVQMVSLRERGLPMLRLGVELPVGQPRTLTITLAEPYTGGELTVLEQPLVRPLAVQVIRPDCPGAP